MRKQEKACSQIEQLVFFSSRFNLGSLSGEEFHLLLVHDLWHGSIVYSLICASVPIFVANGAKPRLRSQKSCYASFYMWRTFSCASTLTLLFSPASCRTSLTTRCDLWNTQHRPPMSTILLGSFRHVRFALAWPLVSFWGSVVLLGRPQRAVDTGVPHLDETLSSPSQTIVITLFLSAGVYSIPPHASVCHMHRGQRV